MKTAIFILSLIVLSACTPSAPVAKIPQRDTTIYSFSVSDLIFIEVPTDSCNPEGNYQVTIKKNKEILCCGTVLDTVWNPETPQKRYYVFDTRRKDKRIITPISENIYKIITNNGCKR